MNSIKETIYMIDAFLLQKQFGTLVIEDRQAFLQLPVGELITLNESNLIEVINDGEYYPITYEEAVNTISTDGWSLFAGLDCRVKI
ncbi:hypothetical protein [Bacillus weihaiensis]|uniref:Uncharacterized protein n=1 Tax=Bacillus weihaiensis TaxID=1547283 RepID=A0A1L3MU57_9BACI|nr:hypothetical protein [Bacillus weihaiensis]APH05862.1 hypothetical protein A9C19_14580 [Bacillus weihaiensis]